MTDIEARFECGEQIAYVPLHASGDIEHPDVEFGFVTSQRGHTVFCRYWRKGYLGDLRTRANSEGTPADMLVRHQSVFPGVVQSWLNGIEAPADPAP